MSIGLAFLGLTGTISAAFMVAWIAIVVKEIGTYIVKSD
jgi:hypothetical protein